MENIVRKGTDKVCRIRYSESGTPYITFKGLEDTGIVKHLFTTRLGGVSKGEFTSLNLSFTRGDDRDLVLENYKRVADILGCGIEDMVCSDQTHTTNVRVVTKLDASKGILRPRDYADIDGLVTNERGIVLATFYADCVPLYIVDPIHQAIGLSHSGWRGSLNRMGRATLEVMNREYGTNPKDVRVAIGPSICQNCYEVSEDVALEFAREFNTSDRDLLYKKDNGKYQLNLWHANEMVFMEAGVPRENIETTDICTCCNPDFLFSHRASKGKRGNLGAFLGLL